MTAAHNRNCISIIITRYILAVTVKSNKGFPPVIFFDGVCGLCNGFVTLLLRLDRGGRYLFAPLQGRTAQHQLPLHLSDSPGTLVLLDGEDVVLRSEAVIRIVAGLGGIWRMVGLVRLVPRFLRDSIYNALASRRYRWFGRRNVCRVPTPEQQWRFLD